MTTDRRLRKEKRERMAVRVVAGLAIFALGGAVYAVIGTAQNSTEITQIQHSACAADPASLECQRIKAESDEHQPVVFACIPIRKVAKDTRLLALTKCKEAAERAESNSSSKGVVPQPDSTGHQQPSPPSHGGHPNNPSKVGESTPEPKDTGGSLGSGSSAPLTPEPEATTPEAPPVSEPAPIRETVESVTAPVKEAVCNVNALGVRVCLP